MIVKLDILMTKETYFLSILPFFFTPFSPSSSAKCFDDS